MNIQNQAEHVSRRTPDPAGSLKNLKTLLRENPGFVRAHQQYLPHMASLFAHSQFLADFCIQNVEILSSALRSLPEKIDSAHISSHISEKPVLSPKKGPSRFRLDTMKFLRELKKRYMLIITMRDISGISTLQESMSELTSLADAITECALESAVTLMREKFGEVKKDEFSLIGLGKLGAGELNYSSDIDLISLYLLEDALSTGVLSPSGVRINRISSHEYFCRLTEMLTAVIQSPTEDGIAYRVDLRLRPNGQKGPLSLPLKAYLSYYEAYGKTWERMALIRARPVAGSRDLGEAFLSAVEPFVWKRSIDYNDVEEIRQLKKKIDTLFDTNDIKRGYGGIREIEFFVHTFQLIYGGEKQNLRKGSLLDSLGNLEKEHLLSSSEVTRLAESYLFLRRIEHFLQMKDDLQTYSLPTDVEGIGILSKKMDFPEAQGFISALKLRRIMVRDMYNSLLGTPEIANESLFSLREELPDNILKEYLAYKGFRDVNAALRHLSALHDIVSFGKTLSERTLLRKTIPLFLEKILHVADKDRALSMLVSFIAKIGMHEAYLDLLLHREDSRHIIIDTFSMSTYLSRLLLSLDNLEALFEFPDIRLDFSSLKRRLIQSIRHDNEPMNVVREYRMSEEFKSGLLFLKGNIDVYGMFEMLCSIADSIMNAIVHSLHAESGFAVIALGGYGARELNIGSDLDLILVRTEKKTRSSSPYSLGQSSIGESFLRILTEYTEKGVAYKVDMRLRPDGSKGILQNTLKGYRNYYLNSAQPWEIQVLLRARPVAGEARLLSNFQVLRKQIILQRGHEVTARYIRDMRKRILSETSRESMGFDIKTGPGGIKELEFLVQYLQLVHCRKKPRLITSDTTDAIRKLAGYGLLTQKTAEHLMEAHRFMRTLDTLLRLNGQDVLRTDSETVATIAGFLKLQSPDELSRKIVLLRQKTSEVASRVYAQDSVTQ